MAFVVSIANMFVMLSRYQYRVYGVIQGRVSYSVFCYEDKVDFFFFNLIHLKKYIYLLKIVFVVFFVRGLRPTGDVFIKVDPEPYINDAVAISSGGSTGRWGPPAPPTKFCDIYKIPPQCSIRGC